MTTFIKISRTSLSASKDDAEEIFINAAGVKYLARNPEGGSLIHLFDEEMPLQAREACEQLIRQPRLDAEDSALPDPGEIAPPEQS